MNSLYDYTAHMSKSDIEMNKHVIMTLRKHLNRNVKQLIETLERDSALRKTYSAEYDHLQTLHAFVNKCAVEYVQETMSHDSSKIASAINALGQLSATALHTLAKQQDNVAVQALAKNELEHHLFP